MKKMILIAFILSLGTSAFAQEAVEVPEDELARESVTPVFDNTVSVKNRNVNKEGSFDVGVFGGLALTEPIANTTKLGFEINYHFAEEHSLGAFFTINNSGLSKDAQSLKDSPDFKLDFNRAPKPKNSMMLDYNYTPFYGKLSVTKEGVINTTIAGLLSAGVVKYEHKSYPAIALGIGQRFFFGNHFSVKLDFRLFAHNAPIPFKKGSMRETDPVPELSSFDERITYTSNLQLGINYLF